MLAPLSVADCADRGDVVHLQRAIAARPGDIDVAVASGFRPLHLAIAGQHVEAAEVLLRNGANPNARGGPAMAAPLHLCATRQSSAETVSLCVRLLLKYGADARCVTQRTAGGDTVLHHTAREGNAEATQAICATGADVDVRNAAGETPLLLAAGNRHVDTVVCLLNHGADPRQPDRRQKRRRQTGTGSQPPCVLDLVLRSPYVSKSAKARVQDAATTALRLICRQYTRGRRANFPPLRRPLSAEADLVLNEDLAAARCNVDDKLRGSLYHSLRRQRGQADSPSVSPSPRATHASVRDVAEATACKAELDNLTEEIRRLQAIGCRDPEKERRREQRLRRLEEKRERKEERKRQREGEQDREPELLSPIGDLVVEKGALQDTIEVLPREEGFTLRRIACGGAREGPRGGLFGLINGIEQRLAILQNVQKETDRRCKDLHSQHQDLMRDLRGGKRGRRLRGTHSPRQAVTGAPAALDAAGADEEELVALPLREQRQLEQLDCKLTSLESRILHEAKEVPRRDREGGAARVVWWIVRVWLLVCVVGLIRLHGACDLLLGPAVWR